MKCRRCKRQYESEEWRKTGTLNGFCSSNCRRESEENSKVSPLSKVLIKEMNEVRE